MIISTLAHLWTQHILSWAIRESMKGYSTFDTADWADTQIASNAAMGVAGLVQTAAAAMAKLVFLARSAGAKLVAANLIGITSRLPANDTG